MHALLGLLALSDVFANADQAIDFPSLVVDRKAPAEYPADRAIGPDDAKLLFMLIVKDGLHARMIIRMHGFQPGLRVVV